MALYHLHKKIHSKQMKNGGTKEIAAIVAYRHCTKYSDDYDFTNKRKELKAQYFLMPEQYQNLKLDAHTLWNTINKLEKRKDAQLCAEIEISLQKELTLEQNIACLNELLKKHCLDKNIVCDVSIHQKNDNIHAHVLMPLRPLESVVTTDSPGFKKLTNNQYTGPVQIVEMSFGKKFRSEFYSAGKKVNEIDELREDWANICNTAFAQNSIKTEISHLSLKAQREEALLVGDLEKAAELDREPCRHFYRPTKAQAEENVVFCAYSDKNKIFKSFKKENKTFEQALAIRAEKRKGKIIENVSRYIKNRSVKLAKSIQNACRAANESIEQHTSFTREFKERILAFNIARDQQRFFSAARLFEEVGNIESRTMLNNHRSYQAAENQNVQRIPIDSAANALMNELDSLLSLNRHQNLESKRASPTNKLV